MLIYLAVVSTLLLLVLSAGGPFVWAELHMIRKNRDVLYKPRDRSGDKPGMYRGKL